MKKYWLHKKEIMFDPPATLRYLFLAAVLCIFSWFSCKNKGTDWQSPETAYSHLCSCKNKAGKTIDEQWAESLKGQGILNRTPDELIRAINNNPEMLYDMLENHFIKDEQYKKNLSAVIDTLRAHGAPETPEMKGNFSELFSLRSRYPACVMGISYVRRSF